MLLTRPRSAAAAASSVFAVPRPTRASAIYTRGALVLAAVAFALRYHGLFIGFAADDFAQLGMLSGDYLVHRAPWDLFTFSDGSLADTKVLMHGGFYPWWAYPGVRLSMLRPLSSLLMWLDFRLFGENPLGYHLHSLLWWLLLLAVVARLFYRLLRVEVALLAFAFFALDESLGLPLGWIANRNAVISALFALCALLAYLRWREGGTRRDLLSVLLAMSVALAAGEYALCVLGFFASYELVVAEGPLTLRARALWPALVPAALYMVLRSLLGHAPHYSGVYLDPLVDTHQFFVEFSKRLPALLADLVLNVRADFYTFGLPWTYALVKAGRVPESWLWTVSEWRRIHVMLGIVAFGALVGLVRSTPRDPHTRNARWLLLGGLLAILPVTGSFPSSRLMLVAVIGFAPFLSTWVLLALADLRARYARARLRTALLAAVASTFALYHLIVPAWQTYIEIYGTYLNANAVRRTVLEMQVDDRTLPQKRMVVVSALEGGASLYIPLTRARYRRSVPETCWTLSLTAADHLFTRDTSRSFILSPMSGYALLAGDPENMLRPTNARFRVGQSVDVGGMRVKVLALLRGAPKAIRVSFDVPLEDPSLLLVQPTSKGLHQFHIPSVGQSVIIPTPGLLP
jgi:hypothetical protein